MRPAVRKFALTAHVMTSVGWLGAVAAFLALAITGLQTPDARIARAAYIGMELTGWLIIVPLSFASFVTGVIQSLGTPWGLFRHYWVIVKLAISVLATALLLVHMQPVSHVARLALDGTLSGDELIGLRKQLLLDAAAAVVALAAATVLSVYKPKGVTRYGWRKAREERTVAR
jgi:hypothetical protein